jgi:endo-1,4-beta-D-glucanase Y
LFGMRGKLACEDGQMGNHGVRAEFLEVFSHTERWKAREEEDNLYHRQHDECKGRHQRVDEEAVRILIWMGMDQMDTGTSRMD